MRLRRGCEKGRAGRRARRDATRGGFCPRRARLRFREAEAEGDVAGGAAWARCVRRVRVTLFAPRVSRDLTLPSSMSNYLFNLFCRLLFPERKVD